jgi:hypothetical protein
MKSKQYKYNPKPVKSREQNSGLIKAKSYSAKANLSSDFNKIKPVKTIDLGNGFFEIPNNS